MTNEEIQKVLEALANGINPNTGELMEGVEDIFTHDVIEALNYARGTVDFRYYIEKSGFTSTKKKKQKFSLSQEEKDQIQLNPNIFLPVSQIAGVINGVIPSGQKKMSPAKINTWLTRNGYLEDQILDGKTAHKLTQKAIDAGARGVICQSQYGGRYWNNSYPMRLQLEIIEHAEEIMNGETAEDA